LRLVFNTQTPARTLKAEEASIGSPHATGISILGFQRDTGYALDMDTATVITENGRQTVRLPSSVHLPNTVTVRQEGEAVVLEPARPSKWPQGFFESIHITDPTFTRPSQGELPPVKKL
jgi:virulence-associated protein VagC